MDNNNFWPQEDENEVFRDIPDEVVEGDQAPAVSVRTQYSEESMQNKIDYAKARIAEEELIEDQLYDEEPEEVEDYAEVLSDARLRLEQGRLYELIMNHDLFQGVDADSKAIVNVQKEFRKFAKERMEIMLGMRQEQAEDGITSVSVELPFNALEIRILKDLASAASKGATATPEAEAQTFVPTNRTGLNPIQLQAKKQPNPIRRQVRQSRQARPLSNAPRTPIRRTRQDNVIDQILREEGVTREELDRTFNPNYKPLDKDPATMSEHEVIARNKHVGKFSGSQARVDSSQKLPMPTQEQEELMYLQRAQTAAAHPQMQSLMKLLTNKQKQ